MRILNKLFRRDDAATIDARRIYGKLMAQSRDPQFYAAGRFNDDYDGRIDVLTLHIAAILSNLNRFGQNGERLGQALFDEMKDDFEIALREEALSDASVKKRIQPMISLFYDRVKRYAEALHADEPSVAINSVFIETLPESSKAETFGGDGGPFSVQISNYLRSFDQSLSSKSIGDIALTNFDFPTLSA
jgi:hypothetical protein